MASWFRSWHGAPTDNKWLVIGRRANVAPGVVSAVAWALFDYASQTDDRGSVDGFDVETYCAFSGFSEDDINHVVSAMCEKCVIIDGRLAAWDKRQPKREDDSYERVKAFRERKNVTEKDVTQCNALKRNETTQNRTDTESDTEQSRSETTVVVVADAPNEIGEVFSYWQDNMPGTMTPVISDDLSDLVTTYGSSEVINAITEATRANARNMRYVCGILRKRQNHEVKPAANGNSKFNGGGKVTNLDRTNQAFSQIEEMMAKGNVV